MTVYLASPGSQMQAASLVEMPVLLSFALWQPWMESYQQSFGRVLIDSGAYSELTGNAKVDVAEYRDWSTRWMECGRPDAVAGLDDIRGNWRRSITNYEAFPESFPTFHPGADPIEVLPELVQMARERPSRWLGIGMVPPRTGRGDLLAEVLAEIPDGIHVHGWALREYWNTHRRLDSVDSTNWWRDGLLLRAQLPWLTPAQATELVVTRYRQESRTLPREEQGSLFAPAPNPTTPTR